MPSRRQAPSLDCPGGAEAPLYCNIPLIQRRLWTGVASTSARSRVSGRVGCGHAARVNLGFRASLEAQLLMVARRLSHRVVAIGLFPPSSDSWHPTHSTHKFTRATAWGGAIPGVRSSDGWLLAHSRESAVALSIIIVHCRQTRGNIGKSAPVPFYPSTVIEISDGMLVRATCPR